MSNSEIDNLFDRIQAARPAASRDQNELVYRVGGIKIKVVAEIKWFGFLNICGCIYVQYSDDKLQFHRAIGRWYIIGRTIRFSETTTLAVLSRLDRALDDPIEALLIEDLKLPFLSIKPSFQQRKDQTVNEYYLKRLRHSSKNEFLDLLGRMFSAQIIHDVDQGGLRDEYLPEVYSYMDRLGIDMHLALDLYYRIWKNIQAAKVLADV